jgi:DNA gyrase inhibitor GyrI
MAELDVRIEQLPGMWVASVHGSGETPEKEAWRRLREWATPKGLLSDTDQHPVFGFNNPSPSSETEGYGYELWIRVDAPEDGEQAVSFKQFEGGRFAVTVCSLFGEPNIVTTWRMLWEWAQAGPYRWRQSQELEKVLNPNAAEVDMVLELYLPIDENAQ